MAKFSFALRIIHCCLLAQLQIPIVYWGFAVPFYFVQDCRPAGNLVPRVFSLSNMAAAGEKTLAHSELKRSLIGAFHGAFIRTLSLVYSFQNKDG